MMQTGETKVKSRKFVLLLLATVGIVYGDIGTSPVYTLKVLFSSHLIACSTQNILGVVSLIFWTLTIIVAIKYVGLMLNADNNGEGGVLALTSLIKRSDPQVNYPVITVLGIVATSLFYGSSVITPAISVLGALEGLSVITSNLDYVIVPCAVVLIFVLFVMQKHGTHRIGFYFGPIMLLWFTSIGLLGINQIIKTPEVLLALNPLYALRFVFSQKGPALFVIGCVILALSGAEALYADMGHFSKRSIRLTWWMFVFPALILNYFGQGALILMNQEAISNPFYLLAPSWALKPLIILASVATIIASQAVISGIFSLGWQAIQFLYLPRMHVIHTSDDVLGQVYIPSINYITMILTISAVLIFKTSSGLANAYVTSISGIFLITSMLAMILARNVWKWSMKKLLCVWGPLFMIDLCFCIINLPKILDGSWFPLLIGAAVFVVITTWLRGMSVVTEINTEKRMSIAEFLPTIPEENIGKIPGTAVYMNRIPGVVPSAFKIQLKHNKFIHGKILFLTIITKNFPKILTQKRIKITKLRENFYQVLAYYGFIETPDIQDILKQINIAGINVNTNEISYFLSREIPVASKYPYLKGWRKKLFIFLVNNSVNATEFFQIPYKRAIELCVRFKI